MGQVDIPTDAAPNGYVSCPYDSEIAAALDYLKRECDSQEGWSNIGTCSISLSISPFPPLSLLLLHSVLTNVLIQFWNIGTSKGVRKEKKSIPGDNSGVPLVRGIGTVKNVSVDEFLPIIAHPGPRKNWDPRFTSGHALEKYSRESYKVYTLQK